jgi:type II secretory pathway component PulJ
MRTRAPADKHQRGIGLVEMLVSITLGLFLIGATAGMLVSQLAEHRRMLLDTRMTQELRAVLDLVARDVKRASYWGSAADARWAGGPASAASNPYQGLHPAPGASDSRIGYAYSRDSSEDQVVAGSERFGLRLNTSNRSADWRTSGTAIAPSDGDTWQALNDPGLVRVTRVSVSSQVDAVSLADRCASVSCPASTPDCPPHLDVRQVDIEVEGMSTSDASLRRSLKAHVSLRNPAVVGTCPGP